MGFNFNVCRYRLLASFQRAEHREPVEGAFRPGYWFQFAPMGSVIEVKVTRDQFAKVPNAGDLFWLEGTVLVSPSSGQINLSDPTFRIADSSEIPSNGKTDVFDGHFQIVKSASPIKNSEDVRYSLSFVSAGLSFNYVCESRDEFDAFPETSGVETYHIVGLIQTKQLYNFDKGTRPVRYNLIPESWIRPKKAVPEGPKN